MCSFVHILSEVVCFEMSSSSCHRISWNRIEKSKESLSSDFSLIINRINESQCSLTNERFHIKKPLHCSHMSSSSFKHQKMQEKVTKWNSRWFIREVDTNYRTISCKSTRNDERLWLKMSHNDLQNASPSLNRNSVVVSESAKTDTNRERLFEDTFEQCNNLQKMLHPSSQLESTWHRANASHNHFLYDFCRIAQKMTDCCSPVNHGSRTTQGKCVWVAFVLADQSENLTTFLFAPRLSKESCDAHEECTWSVVLRVLLVV